MRISVIAVLSILLLFLSYYLLTQRQLVSVIDAHYDGSTEQIIVDKLPAVHMRKISWWEDNQNSIQKKYHIPSGDKGPILITIYEFGAGYQQEDKEDMLCFPDMKTPENCIDKNIVMRIWRTRDGVKYQF